MNKKEIKEKAETLFKEFGLTIPFSVSTLASALNIDVEVRSSEEIFKIVSKKDPEIAENSSKDHILGFYNKNEGKFYINDTDQSILRQRFTIAHEIGHYILHNHSKNNNYRKVVLKQDLLSFIPDDNVEIQFIPGGGSDSPEWEANQFAAYLLIPDKEIIKRLPLIELWPGGEAFIKGLANLFGVSLEAMRIRLKTFKSENPQIWDKYNLTTKVF